MHRRTENQLMFDSWYKKKDKTILSTALPISPQCCPHRLCSLVFHGALDPLSKMGSNLSSQPRFHNNALRKECTFLEKKTHLHQVFTFSSSSKCDQAIRFVKINVSIRCQHSTSATHCFPKLKRCTTRCLETFLDGSLKDIQGQDSHYLVHPDSLMMSTV